MDETKGSNTPLALTLEQVRDSISGYLAQGHSGHYNIGKLYRYVVANNLAATGGYDSAQDFFSQNFKALSKATLSLYGTVSQEFSEPICVAYGMTHLGTLLTYENLSGVKLPEGDPGSVPIEVPGEDGVVQRKPFADCSQDELRLALKHKRKPIEPVPAVDAARVQFLSESVARYFSENSRVRVNSRVHRGKTLVTMQDVPLSELERFAEALLDGMQPVRAVG